jgi:pimeloyl-ACP methyl ester carboxylesterase
MTTLVDLPQGQLAIAIYEPEVHKGDVILVHGFTGSKEDFDYIAPLLAARGYRVFAPDLRAQHESPFASDASGYSLDAFARDVVAISHHYKLDRPHLFGHSYGGATAQRAVAVAPDQFRSLTLFCSGPSAMPKPRFSTMLKEKLEGKSMQEAWDEFAQEMYATHPRKELMKKRWLANDPLALITMSKEISTFASVIPAVAVTKIPSHIVYGESDDAWPLEMQDQMAADLSAPVTVIKDAGHCPNEEQPEATAKVLADFWDSLN